MRRMQNDYDGLSERNSDDGGRTWRPLLGTRNLSANQCSDHHITFSVVYLYTKKNAFFLEAKIDFVIDNTWTFNYLNILFTWCIQIYRTNESIKVKKKHFNIKINGTLFKSIVARSFLDANVMSPFPLNTFANCSFSSTNTEAEWKLLQREKRVHANYDNT